VLPSLESAYSAAEIQRDPNTLGSDHATVSLVRSTVLSCEICTVFPSRKIGVLQFEVGGVGAAGAAEGMPGLNVQTSLVMTRTSTFPSA